MRAPMMVLLFISGVACGVWLVNGSSDALAIRNLTLLLVGALAFFRWATRRH